MNELQSKLLEGMIVFDRFCRENNIPYYMLGGTMLGAYRHKGFIPWDDDIDVGIPRTEYRRFLELAAKQLPKDYVLRHRSVEKNVPYAFAHVEDKTTTYIENRRNRKDYAGGVYIEIFPIDGCSDSSIMQRIQELTVAVKKRMLYALIMDYNEKHRVFYKAFIIKTIRKFCSIDGMTAALEKSIRKYPYETSSYASNHLGHWGRRENIPKEQFAPGKEYEFEGHMFYGVAEPEAYLTALYGEDYMTAPSVEEQERGKHPAYFMDLDMPYETYRENRK